MFHAARLFVLRAPGRGIMSLFLTLLCPPPLFIAMRDVTELLRIPPIPPINCTQPTSRSRQWLQTSVCAFLCAGVITACAFLALLGRGNVWRAALLSPPGAVLRYSLSVLLNRDEFPHGTLLANILACVVDGMLASLLYRGAGGFAARPWLIALFTGFGGALGTVSAFAAELATLSPRNRLLYGFMSLLAAQAILIVIYGAVVWTS